MRIWAFTGEKLSKPEILALIREKKSSNAVLMRYISQHPAPGNKITVTSFYDLLIAESFQWKF